MSLGAAVRRREIDVVSVDLFPNLLGVARRSVAVEVTQVTVDFVQVPLLKAEKRGGRYRADTKEKKEERKKRVKDVERKEKERKNAHKEEGKKGNVKRDQEERKRIKSRVKKKEQMMRRKRRKCKM